MTTPLFETARLRVRFWAESDLDDFARMTADPRIMQWIGDGKPLDRARTAEWLTRTRQNNQWGFGSYPATFDGVIIGWCSFGPSATADFPREADFGYALALPYWGQGFGRELAEGVVAHCRVAYPGIRLVASVDPGNVASVRILVGLGFLKEREGVDEDGLPTWWYGDPPAGAGP